MKDEKTPGKAYSHNCGMCAGVECEQYKQRDNGRAQGLCRLTGGNVSGAERAHSVTSCCKPYERDFRAGVRQDHPEYGGISSTRVDRLLRLQDWAVEIWEKAQDPDSDVTDPEPFTGLIAATASALRTLKDHPTIDLPATTPKW